MREIAGSGCTGTFDERMVTGIYVDPNLCRLAFDGEEIRFRGPTMRGKYIAGVARVSHEAIPGLCYLSYLRFMEPVKKVAYEEIQEAR